MFNKQFDYKLKENFKCGSFPNTKQVISFYNEMLKKSVVVSEKV